MTDLNITFQSELYRLALVRANQLCDLHNSDKLALEKARYESWKNGQLIACGLPIPLETINRDQFIPQWKKEVVDAGDGQDVNTVHLNTSNTWLWDPAPTVFKRPDSSGGFITAHNPQTGGKNVVVPISSEPAQVLGSNPKRVVPVIKTKKRKR